MTDKINYTCPKCGHIAEVDKKPKQCPRCGWRLSREPKMARVRYRYGKLESRFGSGAGHESAIVRRQSQDWKIPERALYDDAYRKTVIRNRRDYLQFEDWDDRRRYTDNAAPAFGIKNLPSIYASTIPISQMGNDEIVNYVRRISLAVSVLKELKSIVKGFNVNKLTKEAEQKKRATKGITRIENMGDDYNITLRFPHGSDSMLPKIFLDEWKPILEQLPECIDERIKDLKEYRSDLKRELNNRRSNNEVETVKTQLTNLAARGQVVKEKVKGLAAKINESLKNSGKIKKMR